MKKYIFEDGQEYRGIIVNEFAGYGGWVEVLIDENLNRHVLDDMPEIERVTFTRGIKKELRDAFISYREANSKKVSRGEEIEEEMKKLRNEKLKLASHDEETKKSLEEIYQNISGIYTEGQFIKKLNKDIQSYLRNKYSAVEHAISSISSDVHVYRNVIVATIPVDIVRHPQEGLWDLFLEYDNTLHSYGEDMTEEVLKVEHKAGLNLKGIKEQSEKLSTLKFEGIDCQTNISAGKIAALDVVVHLEFDSSKEYNDGYFEDILSDIERLF